VITLTDAALGVLAGPSIKRFARIESWQGDTLLAADIPLVSATEEGDDSLRVPERITFTVPAVEDGYAWVPSEYDSPLGAYGQQVRVSLGIEVSNGQIEYVNRGWFLINTTSTQGDTLTVEALGLLSLVDEAVLPTEYQPKTGATLAAVVRALVEPGITVNTDSAPADRAALTTITYSDNRLDSVLAVVDAWPAIARMTEDGFLEITPVPDDPVQGDVVLTLTDGTNGTVIDSAADVSREGAFNSVVAKGQYPDTDATKAGQEIIQTVYDTDPASPYRNGGPFSPYLVPYGYSSPLLTTPAQTLAAAKSVLKRLRKNASRTVQVTCVPHPGIQLGDVVNLTSERLALAGVIGTVDAFTLPYLAEGGAMGLTVRLEV
jgi:hypothetical protein